VRLLTGEIALVTGSTKGIGRAIAEELAREGALVAVAGRNQADAASVAAGLGDGHIGVALDTRDAQSVEAAVAAVVESLGEPTVLVNNAGINRIGAAEELSDADWHDVLEVNLVGTARCCRAVGKRMLARGRGVIVNVASITGAYVGMPGRAPYAASKAGIVGLTRVLAVEWAPRGVRVVCVAPGPVRTPMVERAIEDGILDEGEIAGRTPAGRLASPADVAGVVALVASPKAEFVVGQTLVVDGGYSAYGAAHPVPQREHVRDIPAERR
jgi:NAD(P)-dependent dehydrogenase (short-subunit alcohol dehydrogenase family)